MLRNVKMGGVILVSLIALATQMTSCRSAKSGPGPGEKEVNTNPAIEYAEAKPTLRQWGEGTAFSLSDATAYAELDARAKFTRALETTVTSAQDNFNQQHSKASSDGRNGSGLHTDEVNERHNLSSSVASNVIKNTTVVKSSRYQKTDGQYHVYVTIEYKGEISDLAADLAKNVGQQLSDEEKMRIDYDYEKYKKQVMEELQRMGK